MKTLKFAAFFSIFAMLTLFCGAADLPLQGERDAYTPCAAFGEGMAMVAWQSGRTAPGPLTNGLRFASAIVACRVTPDGSPLDKAPFVVCDAADLREAPRIAYAPAKEAEMAGGVFLLVWQDLRNGDDWDVYASRVTAEGKVLEPNGLLVAGGAKNQAKPRVTWDGKNFVVVWQGMNANRLYDCYAARLTAKGELLDREGILVASANFYHCADPAAAGFGNGRSLIFWLGSAPFAGNAHKTPAANTQILADGKLLGTVCNVKKSKHGPGDRATPLWLAAGDETFMAVWKTMSPLGRGDAPNDSHALLLNAAGERQGEFILAPRNGRVVTADVAWAGSGAYLIGWTQYVREKDAGAPFDALFAAYASSEGKLLGEPRRIAGTSKNPAANVCVAADGNGASLVAYEHHPASGEIPIHIAVQTLSRTTDTTTVTP